jgi:plasmid stability protein
MKNITVSVDDEVYRRARVRAAELETSVSALVRKYLQNFAAGESDFERLKREEAQIREKIETFSGADRLSRGDLYDRTR